jgi:hypothetical protein
VFRLTAAASFLFESLAFTAEFLVLAGLDTGQSALLASVDGVGFDSRGGGGREDANSQDGSEGLDGDHFAGYWGNQKLEEGWSDEWQDNDSSNRRLLQL